MPSAERPAHTEADEIAAFLASAGVPPDARILDVPCGIGRRAHGLAERGFHVTAVDTNAVALDALRRRTPKSLAGRLDCLTAAAETLPGLPPGERFDVVLCLDHPVGRAARAADVAFLARLREHLRPGGQLLLDLLHRDFFAARPRPVAYHVIGNVEQHEFRSFDPVSGILDLTWKFYERAGDDLRFRGTSTARLTLLAPHEAEGLLREAGWAVEAWYGGWGRAAVASERRKLLLVARPAARS